MKNQQKTISRKTLLKSILTLSSIGLIASGAATGIILSTSRNAKLNNTQAQTNKVMGKYCRDTSNGSNITQTQLIDHVKAVSDKLQLQLKAA
jgi:intracellular sulfur oxidation DsrE/DsrF family protein